MQELVINLPKILVCEESAIIITSWSNVQRIVHLHPSGLSCLCFTPNVQHPNHLQPKLRLPKTQYGLRIKNRILQSPTSIQELIISFSQILVCEESAIIITSWLNVQRIVHLYNCIRMIDGLAQQHECKELKTFCFVLIGQNRTVV